jgi:predicted nucleic acid-binding protein
MTTQERVRLTTMATCAGCAAKMGADTLASALRPLAQTFGVAPDLLVAECANILWKKTRRNELTLQEALLAARLLQRADIELAPMRALLATAAADAGSPAYDCVYLALAESLPCDLVTADQRLCARLCRRISVESAC